MSSTNLTTEARRCANCGADFVCGAASVNGCWCAQLPPLPKDRLVPGADCVCAACLGQRWSTVSPAAQDDAR